MARLQQEPRASGAEDTATLSPEPPTPLRSAKVVVVLNASDRDHFSVSGDGSYQPACPPWASLQFLTDDDISEALPVLLAGGDVDAVVFASNALSGAISQKAVAEPRFASLWNEDGPASDVGVLVMHQYLQPDAVLQLDFLGSPAFALAGRPARRFVEQEIRFDLGWRFLTGPPVGRRDKRFLDLSRGYGPGRNCVWTRFDLKHPGQWERLAWDQRGEPLVVTCSTGDRVVIASLVPIDLTGAHELLGSLLAACLRPRGCLLVEAPNTTGSSAFTTALASAIDRQRFVHRVRPTAADEIDPASAPFIFFDELIVAPEWPVDEISSLNEEAVLRKLEQGGSIVATFSGPGGRPVAVRLSGQPQYAKRANHVAAWLVPRLTQFRGDVWCMRGLLEVVLTTQEAYEDKRLIPQALRVDFVRRHLLDYMKARVKDNNVDEIPLATLGTYATLKALGEREIDGMRIWADRHLDEEFPSVIAQALTLVPELATPERKERIRAAAREQTGPPGDARLLRAYEAVLFAETAPELVASAAADRSLGLGVQAELLRAVARHRIPASKSIVDLAAYVRERIDRLALGEGALEAICLGNSALIELARRQGIGPSIAVRDSSRQIDARTVENTELVKDRETALQQAERMRKAGQLAVSALVGVLVLVTAVSIIAILVWVKGDVGSKFGFAAGVLGLMTTLIGFATKRARGAGIPPWPS